MVLDGRNGVLIDCQIYDRSGRGARLRLAANVKLPHQIRLFDDRAAQVLRAEIVWRRGQNVGVILGSSDRSALTEVEITALRKKFYIERFDSSGRSNSGLP